MKNPIVTVCLYNPAKDDTSAHDLVDENNTPKIRQQDFWPHLEKLIGRPLVYDHKEDWGPIGTVLDAWMEPSGMVMARVEVNREAGDLAEYVADSVLQGRLSEFSIHWKGKFDEQTGSVHDLSFPEVSITPHAYYEGMRIVEVRASQSQSTTEAYLNGYIPIDKSHFVAMTEAEAPPQEQAAAPVPQALDRIMEENRSLTEENQRLKEMADKYTGMMQEKLEGYRKEQKPFLDKATGMVRGEELREFASMADDLKGKLREMAEMPKHGALWMYLRARIEETEKLQTEVSQMREQLSQWQQKVSRGPDGRFARTTEVTASAKRPRDEDDTLLSSFEERHGQNFFYSSDPKAEQLFFDSLTAGPTVPVPERLVPMEVTASAKKQQMAYFADRLFDMPLIDPRYGSVEELAQTQRLQERMKMMPM